MRAACGGRCGSRTRDCILLICLIAFGILAGVAGWSQSRIDGDSGLAGGQAATASSDSFAQWEGLPVRRISFEGVEAARLTPLSGHLAQAEGTPLNR